MKPITVWEKWVGPRRDMVLEHNHIEDGHVDGHYPVAKFTEQKLSWSGQQWVKTHAYLDDNNAVSPISGGRS